MLRYNQSRLTLVGAGPGDPELLTLKAVRAIEAADVILYDSLVNPGVLDYNPRARRVAVGKRGGQPSTSQDKILQLILDFAAHGAHVVRLKGGDPMVFGRATEEIEWARAHQIPVEVVPGISSYAGMAAYHQLPLTQRGVSESFWVVTGATRHGKVSADLALAVQSTATVVVLMGLAHLPEIVQVFRQHRPPDYPVGIVQDATLPGARYLLGQLDTIVALQAEHQLCSPALLVFGPAASQALAQPAADYLINFGPRATRFAS